jgi:hypothetical protein
VRVRVRTLLTSGIETLGQRFSNRERRSVIWLPATLCCPNQASSSAELGYKDGIVAAFEGRLANTAAGASFPSASACSCDGLS